MSTRVSAGVTGRIIRHALIAGFADFRNLYSVRTWTLGWMSRVLCQVAFFGLIGRLFDDPETTRYLLIGNAVSVIVLEAQVVVASTAWERWTGTLPLLVASPASPLPVFFGRSLFGVIVGTVSSSTALFVMTLLFGVDLEWPAALAAPVLITLVGFAAYCLLLVLAGLVLRAMHLRNVVSNATGLTLIAFCGVQVPVTFWPSWVQALTQFLPVTHGLQAIRALLDSGFVREVWTGALLELLVALGWLAVAALTFRDVADRGRRTGTIEFSG